MVKHTHSKSSQQQVKNPSPNHYPVHIIKSHKNLLRNITYIFYHISISHATPLIKHNFFLTQLVNLYHHNIIMTVSLNLSKYHQFQLSKQNLLYDGIKPLKPSNEGMPVKKDGMLVHD